MVAPQERRRRVGLSYLNSPGPLLKSMKSRAETATTTTTTATATATATTKTTKKTSAAAAPKPNPKPNPEPEPRIQNNRSQLKIPEPVPDDIFAPPLASSDVEDDDSAEDAKAILVPDQLFADSSDSDSPPRGDIASTTFTSLGQKGGRQTRRSTLRETKEAPQLEEKPEESQLAAKKRKRPSDASNDKGKSKKNAPDKTVKFAPPPSYHSDSYGFTKPPKVKATFGRKSAGSQGGRISKVPEETPRKLRPPPEFSTNTPRKSWMFRVPDSVGVPSPTKLAKNSPLPLNIISQHDGDDSDNGDDNDDAVACRQPRPFPGGTKSVAKRKQQTQPLRSKKKDVPKEEGEEEIPPSPLLAKFVLPAKLSDFALPGSRSGGDPGDGDLSDGSSSGLSSLGSLFPDRDGEEDATGAQCPWCGAAVDVKLLKEFSQGKRLNVRLQTTFCQTHRKKSAMVTWESRSYPKVEWANLEKRFKKHHGRLLDIINGEESHYRTALADKIELGQARAMEKEENLNPGYYGPRGFNMMCDYLVREFSDMLKKKAVHDKVISGRGSAFFIQSVLVAELGVQLIMEDMHASREKARQILEESKALGELVHAESWP